MTRIVLVEPDGAGGMAHFAFQLANAIADAGGDVLLLTSRHYELAHLPHRCRLDASLDLWSNIDAAPLAGGSFAWAGPIVRRVRRAFRAVRLVLVWGRLVARLRHERPDAVQFSIVRFPFLAFFLHRLARSGVLLTQVCHEYIPREAGLVSRWLRRLGGRAVYDSFAVIFCLGASVREGLVSMFEVDRARTRLIPMGNGQLFAAHDGGRPTLRQRYGLPPDAPVALFFGGLRPSKGVDDLIAAFVDVRHAVPAARLLVVGLPDAHVSPGAYEAQVRRLGLDGAVTVDPRYVPLDEVGALMRTADVVVLPYRTGTASAVIQVAATFARPVIVTAVGAVAEPVEAGAGGLVVPSRDRMALAGAMSRLLGDPRLAETLGMQAQRHAAQVHRWDEVGRTVLTATEDALAARAAQRLAGPPR